MKKLWLLLILIVIPCVSALEVELNIPADETNFVVDTSTITFKCTPVRDVLENLDTLRLYTNISGSWQADIVKTISNSDNGTEISFIRNGIADGSYEWNCQLNGNVFAPSNREFSISSTPNSEPVFSGTISDQTWDEDTSKDNAFDLDDYFSDDGRLQSLSYDVTGNSNIVINILNGAVSFSQPADWFGIENVVFSASDGEHSVSTNSVKLTVTDIAEGGGNHAPTYSTIPDQEWDENTEHEIDLEDYFSDEDGDSLTYNFTGDLEYIDISIDSDGDVIFDPDDDWTGSEDIVFSASDGSFTTESNEVTLTVSEPSSNTTTTTTTTTTSTGVVVIKAPNPKSSEISLFVNQEKKFKVDDIDDAEYEWTLDDKKVGDDSREYVFKSDEIKSYELKVVVSKDGDSDFRMWTVDVKESTTINAVCGDGTIDDGENCGNCEADVKCGENEECVDEECVEVKRSVITGYAVKAFEGSNKYYALGVIILILLIILGVVVKKGKKQKSLVYFGKKEGFFRKIQRKLRDMDVSRQNKKKEKQLRPKFTNVKQASDEKIGSMHDFIRDSKGKKFPDSGIKKALKARGHSREDVRKAFKTFKNERPGFKEN